jgi:exodeoxyribonuclease VII small subunit
MNMSQTPVAEPKRITFEEGYDRLKQIGERVNSDAVPVHEMVELFAEGKGLDQSLTAYLTEAKSRVEAIERGEGDVHRFTITAPSGGEDGSTPASRTDVPLDGGDFSPAPATPAPADDDIPF